jgi:hypothetical protein
VSQICLCGAHFLINFESENKAMIPVPLNAPELLDREFLTVRAKLLEVAASLDRVQRGEGSVEDDPRMRQLRQALHILATADGNYAEQFQMAFSIPYRENWREEYGVGS